MTEVQGAVLAALEQFGFVPQPLEGPPGSPLPVQVQQSTVDRVQQDLNDKYQINADGSVTAA